MTSDSEKDTNTPSHTRTRKYAAVTIDGARAAVPRDASYDWRDQTRLLKCCVLTREAPKAHTRVSSKAALLSSFSIFAARREPSWENPTPLSIQ